VIYTFQALSEEDRKLWMDVMDGKEPVIEHIQILCVPFLILVFFGLIGIWCTLCTNIK